MNLSPGERLSIRGDLEALHGTSATFYIVFVEFGPVEPNYDQETTSPRNVSLGDGTGRVVSRYKVYALTGRVRYVDEASKLYGRIPLAAETGDAVIAVRREHNRLCELSKNDPDSYLSIGGKTYRIIDLEADGVGHDEERQITARAFKPDWRAPGT